MIQAVDIGLSNQGSYKSEYSWVNIPITFIAMQYSLFMSFVIQYNIFKFEYYFFALDFNHCVWNTS